MCELEGVIGKDCKYNGVLFLLKESNSNNEIPDKFWFREIVNNTINYENKTKKEISNSKRVGTKFTKTFDKLLKIIYQSCDINECAFCNLNIQGGTVTTGKEYNKEIKNLKENQNEFKKYFNFDGVKTEIIFTVKDIYDRITENTQDETCGIEYKNSFLNRKTLNVDGQKIILYCINHPTRSSYPIV